MQRLSAFQFACRATNLVFGTIYELPKIPRPLLKDRQNPMEVYDDAQFLMRYRSTKATVRELLSKLPLQGNQDNCRPQFTPLLQVLLALRFSAHRTFQVVTGDLINMSQPTMCQAINKVTGLIAAHLFGELAHFPAADEYRRVMHEFYKIGNFPRITGCIVCTHARIKSPGDDCAEVFRNRKVVFSITVQVSRTYSYERNMLC